MKYKILAGEKVSALGFGAMRLPEKDGKIDEKRSISLIRRCIDSGINYVDTAFVYHGGESETLVGKALAGSYRNKAMVATKLPVWLCNEKNDFDNYLNEQLKKLSREYIDFYMLHALGAGTFERTKKLDIISQMQKAKKEGKIRHIGFSFHDRFEKFAEIIDSYDWEFCQVQYNYMDEEYQAGTRGLKYAAKKGTGVIVMEPLRGGCLALNVPESVSKIFASYELKRTAAEWALRFVLDKKEVSLVLSGMNTQEQADENIRTVASAEPGALSAGEINIINKAREEFLKLIKVRCTNCGYCMPCPKGVDIPQNFSLYNNLFMYAGGGAAKSSYNIFTPPPKRASSCNNCGECVSKCPQKIAIPEELKRAHQALVNK